MMFRRIKVMETMAVVDGKARMDDGRIGRREVERRSGMRRDEFLHR